MWWRYTNVVSKMSWYISDMAVYSSVGSGLFELCFLLRSFAILVVAFHLFEIMDCPIDVITCLVNHIITEIVYIT